ncbi:helix-turn-helix transcriptional regulator [Pseudoflavonifractor sp. An85]|uniref:helix-turn-helix transcriptional regulator n=1 Tax=Pseudoflavonifractor sp. An85 TaxID=1965661 RepID=UPI000B370E30|nr:helix-turn-helix transcriptional regulator [Pseudoflavonifractor sp. An85]OUN18722.1 hypothetical protein B5G37_13920 [Pseudoflavonifractor sp. An85]
MELKDKLRELRTSFRYSQEEIANYLNVSRQAVSRWETGEAKPCTENLIKLSQLYGGSLYELEDTVIDSLSFQIRLLNDLLKTTVPHSILNQNIEYLVMEIRENPGTRMKPGVPAHGASQFTTHLPLLQRQDGP